MAEIKQLPNTGYAPDNASIAKHLRQQADWMDEPDATPIRNVYLVIERVDGTLHRQTIGKTCDLARVIGILTIAAIRGSIGEE
jgi:hypothetical protein